MCKIRTKRQNAIDPFHPTNTVKGTDMSVHELLLLMGLPVYYTMAVSLIPGD